MSDDGDYVDGCRDVGNYVENPYTNEYARLGKGGNVMGINVAWSEKQL